MLRTIREPAMRTALLGVGLLLASLPGVAEPRSTPAAEFGPAPAAPEQPRVEAPRPGDPGTPRVEPPRPGESVQPRMERPRPGDSAQPRVERPDESTQAALRRLRTEANATPVPGEADARATVRMARSRDAAWLLGLLALHGIAMPVDTAQAQNWFQRAQRLGHPLAPAGLAWCALDGCAGPPHPAAAQPWIDALTRTDPGRALYLQWLAEAGQRVREVPGGRPGPSPASPSAAPPDRSLLLRAARAGNPHAQVELGLDQAEAGRPQEALGLFRAAAARSEAAAANALALEERLRSSGSARAPTAAAELFERARRFHRGEGVPANYTEAVRLYEQAAKAGSAEAKRMLELIFSRPAPGGVDIAWMQQLAHVDVNRLGIVTVQPQGTATGGLRRDPTPLHDLVPREWRERAKTS